MTTKVEPKSQRAKNPARGAKPGERRGGRQKGTPNKVTGELRQMILNALDKAGGVEYLTVQAKENPASFMTLLGKVLPMQVTGEGGGPVKIAQIKLVPMTNERG